MNDDDMVLLVECEDGLEAESVRGLLEAHRISHVVHNDMRSSFAQYTALAGQRPVIFVARRELDTATALLRATPVLDSTETDPTLALDGNVCPVHERPAVAVCARCGTFLCAGCGSLGQPPLCEGCLEVREPRPGRGPVVRAVATLWLAIYALPLLLVAAAVLYVLLVRRR